MRRPCAPATASSPSATPASYTEPRRIRETNRGEPQRCRERKGRKEGNLLFPPPSLRSLRPLRLCGPPRFVTLGRSIRRGREVSEVGDTGAFVGGEMAGVGGAEGAGGGSDIAVVAAHGDGEVLQAGDTAIGRV